MSSRDRWNGCRDPGGDRGHYESYFLRANHPTEPRAFWIRYTLFRPAGRESDAIGELWAIWFDRGRIVAVRQAAGMGACAFARDRMDVAIGTATLVDGALRGEAATAGHRIAWDLRYAGESSPLLLFDEPLYDRRLPKAKVSVPAPGAVFEGSLEVDGEPFEIADWVGSQNHNWGGRHTDAYAWGQVAGFDDAPHVFLECATAQIKLGPVWTPRMTVLVLRVGEREYAFNTIGRALRARGRYAPFRWTFATGARGVRVEGEIEAAPSAFVGLRYLDPPGGTKICLNSKVASAQVTLTRPGQTERFVTRHRAAFEILTDATPPGVSVVADED